MSRPIKSFIDAWTSAKPNKAARNDTAISVWYDWFCSEMVMIVKQRLTR